MTITEIRTNIYPKMNPEPKRLLVEALRSGRFEQGTGTLVRTYTTGRVKHCCLGVLAEVAEKQGVAVTSREKSMPEMGYSNRIYTEDGRMYSGAPPPSVCKWAGIEFDPHAPAAVIDKMITMNDSEKRSFDEIADWVEENL